MSKKRPDMPAQKQTFNFIFIPTAAAALSWSATLISPSLHYGVAVNSLATTSSIQAQVRTTASSSARTILLMGKHKASFARQPNVSLKFALVATTSVIALGVSLIAAAATFVPSIEAGAADLSLLAMLGATTFGTWAAKIAQRANV